ncbi:ubiquitin-associated protein 2-like isoform X2 [Xenopus laevis]|uniref:Ubiquitin-associated protein 2-like isoform X2 n=1 Tax=Xenopus laevis TaxID=8355 RepID=A0A8J1LP78_XENLA|nr:ubiquitin-associated protein 2-like isoform X2 [Xenopus laevis]
MMTSVTTNRARGNSEQTPNQTQHKQRPQATAEQIRLAQMISDQNDADFEEKVKQLIDITGKNQDECVIALHDCNGDINRAINVLLEGNPDTHSWEMVGKKKGVSGQKEAGQTEPSEEVRENRDRERDYSRRRGGAPRRGRGGSRGREFRAQENGLEGGKTGGSSGRGTERGRRGRGRGRGGSGRRGGRFSAQGMGGTRGSPCCHSPMLLFRTFNPADYAEPSSTEDSYGNSSTWNSTTNFEPDDGTRHDYIGGEGSNYPREFSTAPGMIYPGAWRTATEEWGTEDWNEDLSETKVFTASSVSSVPVPSENVTITAGQRIDLAVLLGKSPSSLENETSSLESNRNTAPSQAGPIVFSNSKQNPVSQTSPGSSFSHHTMVSMLGKGFSDSEPKGGTTTGSQFLEQFKTAQALAQLAAQHSQSEATGNTSWDLGAASQSPSLGQYDMKRSSDPFSKRPSFPQASTMMEVYLQEKQPVVSTSSAVSVCPSSPLTGKSNTAPPMSPVSSENQSSSPQPAQQKMKQQKKKASLTSKIPALAVEMPGSSDISGLNLQFGALLFGSEPVLPEYESSPTTNVAVSQSQNSLYTSPVSESPNTITANQSPESAYQGSSSIQSATFNSLSSTQGPVYEQRATQTRRYPNPITSSSSSSPQKDLSQSKNGFSSVSAPTLQAPVSVEVPSVPTVKADSPSASSIVPLSDPVSTSSLLTTAGPHSSQISSLAHSEDLQSAPTTLSTLSSQHQTSTSSSSVRTSVSTPLHTSVDTETSMHPSVTTFSSASSTVPTTPSAPASSSINVGNLVLGLSSSSTIAPSTRSSIATTSGKAPPNLPPGVPPLLPNPYIMAPGLLHAYPPQVYGYEDLQMLQTRFPLDYYSIPFPTPSAPLTGRDGSLANNPYSGDLAKFGRGDASSPAPATTLAQPQQSQAQGHHTTQQTFLNAALPPGYSYTSLPYYTGVPGIPSTFQYGPAVFPVAPTSSKQHGVNVGVNTSAAAFQQAPSYGSHGYNTGFDDMGQVSSVGDFCKVAFSGASAAAQNKAAAVATNGPGAGVSVTSSNTGVPDISGSVYSKTQSFEKQGFHTGTPATSFNLPSALASAGPINPATAAAYQPAPFMHILAPHQQPHSQILHHHLQQEAQLPYMQILCYHLLQDDQSGAGQRNQGASMTQKSQASKSAYSSYSWGSN